MVQSPELQARIAAWRQKAADGTITLDEMKEAIIVMRESRRSASVEAKASRASGGTKAKANADDLLNQLDSL